mgnify:CR=1 FL=1|jgi:hypothetical protein
MRAPEESFSLEVIPTAWAFRNAEKKAVLSSLSNRFQSLKEDAQFVESVRTDFAAFPCFCNLRSGAWYAPSFYDACYFKSTDGHHGQWDFSTVRLNLNVLESALAQGGVMIIDATRQGKQFPDSLSFTIPIWCAVMNAVFGGGNLSIALQPNVPLSIRRDIEERLPVFVEKLKGQLNGAETSASAKFVLPKELRPIWISPDSRYDSTFLAFLQDVEGMEFIPVILVSASHLIDSAIGHAVHRINDSGLAWTYIPGAGDDQEMWLSTEQSDLGPRCWWESSTSLTPSSLFQQLPAPWQARPVSLTRTARPCTLTACGSWVLPLPLGLCDYEDLLQHVQSGVSTSTITPAAVAAASSSSSSSSSSSQLLVISLSTSLRKAKGGQPQYRLIPPLPVNQGGMSIRTHWNVQIGNGGQCDKLLEEALPSLLACIDAAIASERFTGIVMVDATSQWNGILLLGALAHLQSQSPQWNSQHGWNKDDFRSLSWWILSHFPSATLPRSGRQLLHRHFIGRQKKKETNK